MLTAAITEEMTLGEGGQPETTKQPPCRECISTLHSNWTEEPSKFRRVGHFLTVGEEKPDVEEDGVQEKKAMKRRVGPYLKTRSVMCPILRETVIYGFQLQSATPKQVFHFFPC